MKTVLSKKAKKAAKKLFKKLPNSTRAFSSADHVALEEGQ